MDARDWTVALIEPNKFEAQIVIDLLRAAGCQNVRRFSDSAEAIKALEVYRANIILMEVESQPIDGVAWTKQFRRDVRMHNRKAPIFLLSHGVSRSLAETCRHAGANAIIGKPISGRALLGVIDKVLKNPRPFIDAEGYVGPCRRAGIVTAGPMRKRRRADAESAAAPAANGDTLAASVAALTTAADDVLNGRVRSAAGVAATLAPVQNHATRLDDAPMMAACAALSMLLARGIDAHAQGALATCVQGIGKLSNSPGDLSPARQTLADAVRNAVEKASARAA